MRRGIASIDVETGGDGTVEVRWDIDGEPVAVDVAVGSLADGTDHRVVASVAADQRTVRLPAPGAGRHFVSVTPHGAGGRVVAADRRVPFERLSNFRDLGGYPTRTGEFVAWGQVYRAGVIDDLESSDRALLDGLRIRAVFDLRNESERAARPSAVQARALTIAGRPPGEHGARHAPPQTAEEGERLLADVYRGLVDHGGAGVGEVFSALAADDTLPAVIHCHSGKDRTGVVVALLLELLGVERALVLDDYELTDRYLAPDARAATFDGLVANGYSEEAADVVMGTSRRALHEALVRVDEEYGGIDSYLRAKGGMSEVDIARVRRRLLTGI